MIQPGRRMSHDERLCCPSCGWRGRAAQALVPSHDVARCPECYFPAERAPGSWTYLEPVALAAAAALALAALALWLLGAHQ